MGLDENVKPTIDLLLQRVHPDDRRLVQMQLDRAAGGEQNYDYEYRLLTPDGAVKHIHVLAHRQMNEPGDEELVGALMDVTDTRKAQIRFTSTRSSWRRRSVFTNDPRAPDCPGELPVQARTPLSRQFQSSFLIFLK